MNDTMMNMTSCRITTTTLSRRGGSSWNSNKKFGMWLLLSVLSVCACATTGVEAFVSPRNQYPRSTTYSNNVKLVPGGRDGGGGQVTKHHRQYHPSSSARTSYGRIVQFPRGGGSALELSPNMIYLAETLAPKLGILSSTALYTAPAMAVLHAMKKNDIGDLDPIPLALMSMVSIAWFVYGLTVRDPYVVLSNIVGCIGTMGYVVGVLPLLATKQKLLRTTQYVLLGGITATLSLWTYLGLSNISLPTIQSSLGLFASSLFIIMSGSPLSNIQTVLTTKDSSSILGPLTIAQIINTLLWTSYGFAVNNFFVFGPNSIGLVLGLAQLTLKVMYPTNKQPVYGAATATSVAAATSTAF